MGTEIAIRVVRFPGTPTILDPVTTSTATATTERELVQMLRQTESEVDACHCHCTECHPDHDPCGHPPLCAYSAPHRMPPDHNPCGHPPLCAYSAPTANRPACPGTSTAHHHQRGRAVVFVLFGRAGGAGPRCGSRVDAPVRPTGDSLWGHWPPVPMDGADWCNGHCPPHSARRRRCIDRLWTRLNWDCGNPPATAQPCRLEPGTPEVCIRLHRL